MPESVRETLSQARQLIEQGGWIQGTYEDGGAHCSAGALMRCTDMSPVYYKALRQLSRVTDNAYVVSWNDEPGRTAEDVILAFKQAEELCGDE